MNTKPQGQLEVAGVLSEVGAINGWRLLLYALLSGYVVSKTGEALAGVLHGPRDIAIQLPSMASEPTGGGAHASTSLPAAPAAPAGGGAVKVAGIEPAEIEDLAEAYATAYGPLPPEVIASLSGAPASEGLQVGGHPVAWAAGIAAAVVAVGVIAWRAAAGVKIPEVDVHADPIKVDPVKVAPVNVAPVVVRPDLGNLPAQAGQLAAPLSNFLANIPGMGGGGGAPGGGGGKGGGVPGLPGGLPPQVAPLANQLKGLLGGFGG